MREKGGEITRGRKRAPPLRSSRRGKKGERGSVSRSQRSEKRHGGKRERGNFLSLVSGLISCPPPPLFSFLLFLGLWVARRPRALAIAPLRIKRGPSSERSEGGPEAQMESEWKGENRSFERE